MWKCIEIIRVEGEPVSWTRVRFELQKKDRTGSAELVMQDPDCSYVEGETYNTIPISVASQAKHALAHEDIVDEVTPVEPKRHKKADK